MENKNIGLSYGVLSIPLNAQLDEQNVTYDKPTMTRFETERVALNRLRFGSELITESMFRKLTAKLHKNVIKHVAEFEGRSVIKS